MHFGDYLADVSVNLVVWFLFCNLLLCFQMGARHSARREWLYDSSGGAADSTLATGKSTRRSLTSSAKLRNRRSKVARSHSERTPAALSADPLNYDETSVICLQNYSPFAGCSFVSTACQTQVQSVSVMTQTETDQLLGWRMIDDDRYSFASDSLCNVHDIGNSNNCDSSRPSHSRMPYSKLHGVRQESLKHARLTEAVSCSSDKEKYSSVVCSGNHSRSTDETVNPHSCTSQTLLFETDGACSAMDNFKPENNVVQESSYITQLQWPTTKNSTVDVDNIKLPDKRKQSNLSESMERDSERHGSMQVSPLDHIIHRESTVDLGSSFGSLNSEDMMLDTELDDTSQPSNVRSRHSSVDAGSWAHCRRSSSRLVGSKCTVLPECSDYFGHQIELSDKGYIPQRGHTVGRKYSGHMLNESIDSPMHLESAVIDDNIKHAANGWSGLDLVLELSPAEISSRYAMLIVLLA